MTVTNAPRSARSRAMSWPQRPQPTRPTLLRFIDPILAKLARRARSNGGLVGRSRQDGPHLVAHRLHLSVGQVRTDWEAQHLAGQAFAYRK